MRRVSRPARVTLALLAPWLAALAPAPESAAADRPAGLDSAVRFSGPAAVTLRALLIEAHARLGEPACQSVLYRFRDREQRPLGERLDAFGCMPQEYLALLMFYDGSGLGRCHGDRVLAVATPGSRVVFVCPYALRKWSRSRPAWAEAAIIHELLHTLGLCEDPPSSGEINGAILEACWP